jgi:pimeloyl-ACP methyl ester carboxylesterase
MGFVNNRRPHLIFLHGAGLGAWMWDKQREFFEREYVVHTPTLPGHGMFDGAIPGDAVYLSHQHAAGSVARQVGLDSLEGDVTVIGFSLGGQVVIELSTMFPEKVTRTVVVSSLLRPWRIAGLYIQAAVALAPRTTTEAVARVHAQQLYLEPEHFDSYFALTNSMSARTTRNTIRTNFSFAPAPRFMQSDRPVLILAGAQEQRRLREDSARLAQKLARGEFVLVDDVAHGASLARPDYFNQLVGDWIKTVASDIHHHS